MNVTENGQKMALYAKTARIQSINYQNGMNEF